jgi:hypothetical protein
MNMRVIVKKRTVAVAVVLAAVSSLVITGCAGGTSDSSATSKPSSSSSSSATAKPQKAPTFLPEGSAKDNLYYFTWVMEEALAADPATDATTMAQKIADSGFGPTGIQFTLDRTAVGLASDSMFIAVPFAGECLVGQYGPKISGVRTDVELALASGGCLLGTGIQTLG